MLLGHWYLVQPGLARGPLLEMVRWTVDLWPFEVVAPAVAGRDGLGAQRHDRRRLRRHARLVLGGLRRHHDRPVVVTRAALKERYYSAVMAATGLLYLAILTAFGTDLVARAVLAT